MPDFEVLFLSDGGCAVFWDEIVGYSTVRGVRLSYSWSTSRSSSPRESRSWQSKGSRPSLFVDVTKRGGGLIGAILTKAGEDSGTNRRTSLDNLPSIRMVSLQTQIERTKIQDHPNFPPMPLMKEIPYAKSPENAPEMEAAPKNSPMRY
jgi:hypothetical protein